MGTAQNLRKLNGPEMFLEWMSVSGSSANDCAEQDTHAGISGGLTGICPEAADPLCAV